MRTGLYQKYLKRVFDIVFSIIALVILLPLFVVVAFLIRIKLGSPIIFKQKRPGLNAKCFTLYKFRTMTDEKDCNDKLLPDEDRLTKFGQFIRSTSIDELPELWNILKGEMSFVGPRPLLEQYLDLYTPNQMRRHDVLPGLTGLAQVNGRNSITWEDKFSLDIEYVDSHSIWMDLRVLVMTLYKVIKREDISSQTASTMEVFQGTALGDEIIEK